MANKVIEWDSVALRQFGAAIEYIAQDSLQNAQKVYSAVIQKIEALPDYPEMHPPDKYKLNNTGSYRAFELYRLRVAYFVGSDRIRILRVRHTSQEPKTF